MFYRVQLLHNGYWRSTFQGNLKINEKQDYLKLRSKNNQIKISISCLKNEARKNSFPFHLIREMNEMLEDKH